MALSADEIREMAQSIEQLITNVTTQTKINDAIVMRLLALERKLTELTGLGQRSNGEPRVASVASAPAIAARALSAAAPVPAQTPVEIRDPLPMYLGNSLALCRVMKSFAMYVDTRDTYITPRLLLSGEWEPAETQLILRLVRPGMTFVDVGANFGYFTLLAAAGVGEEGRVYAFEPDARNLEILDRNLQVNCYSARVKIFPNAVLDAPKKVQLHRNRRNLGNHTLFVTDRQNADADPVAVDAVRLDDAVEGVADFVKIDAEGREPLIFRGMRGLMARSPKLTILTEFNLIALKAAGFAPQDFLRELGEYGYTVHSVTPQATWIPANTEALLQQRLSTLLLTKKSM
ncbi:MAG TPA: FkbM family methyltransferase [Candidatus Acidoferrales bacterium]|nr:FkbM family methyltransferase [Candidatus Acidoferrales bacterium]